MSAGSLSDDDLRLLHERLQAARQDGPLEVVNTDFFAMPGLSPVPEPRDPRLMCSDSAWDASTCLNHSSMENEDGDDSINSHALSRDSWVVPMLALAAANVLVISAFEVYVLCRAWRAHTPSRRHLFLGQMLLLGLLAGSLTGLAHAAPPSSEWACAMVRLGTGFSYALVYSALLVKLVFLVSLNTGVYLPAAYQALLFLFCMLVQAAIAMQWLGTSGPLCDYSTRDHLLSLFYVVFLIAFCTALSIRSRHFRDNYREAKYIGVTMALTVPIWLAWMLASVILHESYHAACVGFGLLSSCTVTFVIMFLPKSRQLSAMGKEGIYLEDQEHDRFSLRSDTNNERYSPSFYHFKPHKTVMSPGHPHHPHLGSMYKEARPESPYFRAGNSYTGFHRPLRVVPPSATPSAGGGHVSRSHRTTPPSSSSAAAQHLHANLSQSLRQSMPPPPPPYTTRTTYFPSHFFPEKMYHYWQYYYPKLPGIYSRADLESMNNIYTSLHEHDRTKSANPNVYFYKANNYHPGFIY